MAYRVLLVDDDRDLLRMLHDIFVLAKYEVVCVDDGMRAIQAAQRYLPDLIILDLMMPRLSGFQICRMVRHHQMLGQTPIIVMSARSGPRDQEYALKSGASHFLPKPVSPEPLLLMAHTILEGRPVHTNRPPCEMDSGVHWV